MNYCPNCGEKLQSGDTFCLNCGKKIESRGIDIVRPIYDNNTNYFSREQFVKNQKSRVCPIRELSYEERKVSRTVFWLSLLPTILTVASLLAMVILMSITGDTSYSDFYVFVIAPGIVAMLLISLFSSKNYKKDGGRMNGTMRVAFVFRIISTVISSLFFALFLYTSILYTYNPYEAYTFWMG